MVQGFYGRGDIGGGIVESRIVDFIIGQTCAVCKKSCVAQAAVSHQLSAINASTNAQDSVVVTAQYRADLLIPMPIPGFPSGFDLESKAVYKCEFS